MPDLTFNIVVKDDGTAVIQRFTKGVENSASRASRAARRITRGFGNLRRSLQRLPRLLINLRTGLAGLAAGLVIRKVVRSFADFERQMNRVAAITGETVGPAFQRLQGLAEELGRTTVFTATQSAEAMGNLAVAGLNAEQIIAALPRTLELAAAAQIPLADSARIVTGVVKGLRIPFEQLGRANDVLVKAFTSTNLTLLDLGETFKFVGPIATSAGVPFEELTAAIGLAADAGIRGSMAGTSLRRVLISLVAPSTEAKKRLDQLGITISDSAGRLRPLNDIFLDFQKRLNETATPTERLAILADIFGARAVTLADILTNKAGPAFSQLIEKLRDSGGLAERVSEIQLRGLSGALVRMKSAIDGVVITLGQTFKPELLAIVEGIKQFAINIGTGLKSIIQFNRQLGLAAGTGFADFIRDIIPSAEQVVNFILRLKEILPGLRLAFTIVKEGILTAATFIVDKVKTILDAVFEIPKAFLKAFQEVRKAVVTILAEAIRLLGTQFFRLASQISELRIKASGPLAEAFRNMGAALAGFGAETKEGVKDLKALKTLTDLEDSALNSLRGATNSLTASRNAARASILKQKIELGFLIINRRLAVAQTGQTVRAEQEAAAARKRAREESLKAAAAEKTLIAEREASIAILERIGAPVLPPALLPPAPPGPQVPIPLALPPPIPTIAQLLFPEGVVETVAERASRIQEELSKVGLTEEQVTSTQTRLNTITQLLGQVSPILRAGLGQQLADIKAGDEAALNNFRQSLNQRVQLSRGFAQVQATIFGPGGIITTLAQEGSETAFNIAKGFQVANAIMGAFTAITNALAAPFPLNLILPPLIGAQAFLQVRRILATRPGGGGGGGGGGITVPGGAAMPMEAIREAEPMARGGPMVNITVAGFVGDEGVLASELGRVFSEATGDDVDFGLQTSRT